MSFFVLPIIIVGVSVLLLLIAGLMHQLDVRSDSYLLVVVTAIAFFAIGSLSFVGSLIEKHNHDKDRHAVTVVEKQTGGKVLNVKDTSYFVRLKDGRIILCAKGANNTFVCER